MRTQIVIRLALLLGAGLVQLAGQPLMPEGGPVFQIRTAGPDGDVLYLGAEMDPGKLVKGAPYSAESSTEVTQKLADGNRIYHKTAGAFYRDSEGRTRREQSMAPVGPLSAETISHKTVFTFLTDPVAGVSYMLDPVRKEARKLGAPTEFLTQLKQDKEAAARRTAGKVIMKHVEVERNSDDLKVVRSVEERIAASAQKESLGTKAFDSVTAEGTRVTTSIAAGQIGNEQPIEMVNETWYSQQLQAVVMSRHYDPRFGETVFRLSNISTSEPAASLFQVPAGYTIVEAPPEGPSEVIIHKREQR